MDYKYFIIPLGLLIVVKIIEEALRVEKSGNRTYQYKKREYLFTENELGFYQSLVPVAESRGLLVFAKVRLADIIEPQETKHWQAAFNKVRSKHIDFILCDDQFIKPMLAIELDDSTHQRVKRQERDHFVNEALKKAGVPILRVYDSGSLGDKIDAILIASGK